MFIRYWDRKTHKEHTPVSDTLVPFVKSNIQRLTPGTPRLLVFANPVNMELLWRVLRQELARCFHIFAAN
jgi:hypothetical protein